MAGLKGMFTLDAITDYMQSQINEAEQKMIEAFRYEGENFVNKARLSGNYSDYTGNLRSSIGYVILKDGKVIDQNFQVEGRGYDKHTGKLQAMQFVNEISVNYPEGLVLIGVAGMSYAAAVESKGYDVITGSAPTNDDLKDLFNAIKL